MILKLFLTFLKIGAFTFGGGYAMLPLIQAEAAANGWMNAEELMNFVAVSESTPGPLAVNMATFVGMRMGGVAGALACTLGVVLPSFAVILIVARCISRFRSNRLVEGAMSGLRPAVVALIASALLSLGKALFFPNGLSLAAFAGAEIWISLFIFALVAVLAFRKLHPIALICLSAALGVAAGYAFKLPI